MTQFLKFESIEQFRNVIKERERYFPELKEAVFRGTIKIHGTNAAVIVDASAKTVAYQSRNRVISPTDDNLGFATWAAQHEQDWLTLARHLTETGTVHFFGEWFGPGIQKGVAVSSLSCKKFAVFEVAVDGSTLRKVPNVVWPENTHSINEFQTFDVYVDFRKPHAAQQIFHELTTEVEKRCPVGAAFGIEGIGEGLVWTYWHEGRKIRFKTKGEKHSATKVKTIAATDVERFAKIEEFVSATVTQTRLDQGLDFLRASGLDIEIKNIGAFIKWCVEDVLREEADVIEASGLGGKAELSDFKKRASAVAAAWYKDHIA